MKGNFHVQFLGEGVAATSPPYPTPGWATTPVYPARTPDGNGVLRDGGGSGRSILCWLERPGLKSPRLSSPEPCLGK